MLRLNNHIWLYVDVLCFYALYHTKGLDQMNEYGYYGWSKVHDNSVRLPMCFSTYLHNLDLLLYFIISYLFIYTLAIVGCPC